MKPSQCSKYVLKSAVFKKAVRKNVTKCLEETQRISANDQQIQTDLQDLEEFLKGHSLRENKQVNNNKLLNKQTRRRCKHIVALTFDCNLIRRDVLHCGDTVQSGQIYAS